MLTPEEALAAVACRSRDNARTPMQWSGEENAGFTSWYTVASGKSQLYQQSMSVKKRRLIQILYFNFYKKLIALRKDPEYKETVVYGALEPLYGRPA